MRPLADSGPSVAGQVEDAETIANRNQMIRDAVGQLPDEQRDVVILKEFDGRSYLEIAEIIDRPVGTVRSRLHRARKELSIRLQPLLGDEKRVEPRLDASGGAPTSQNQSSQSQSGRSLSEQAGSDAPLVVSRSFVPKS